MGRLIERAIVIVLDGVGVGAHADAAEYGDEGSDSLGHAAEAVGGLRLPALEAMGLGRLTTAAGVKAADSPTASYGRMAAASPGKDTTTGHWELMGIVLERSFPTYPDGFPPEVINEFTRRTGLDVLGNVPAPGTAIIEECGPEHLASGKPIVYTSADSVFQIAAHEDVIPPERLYGLCAIAREMLQGEHAVGRVIARPFTGRPGNFRRLPLRRDFSLPPPSTTLLDVLQQMGRAVWSVGKIADIFAGRGISGRKEAADNEESVNGVLELLRGDPFSGLIFANMVEFDAVWGHRRDPGGYARALEAFDRRLPEVLGAMQSSDLLVITADHGCDPTAPGTDHTREYVPLLVAGPSLRAGADLGNRSSLADLAATLAHLLDVPWRGPGASFALDLI